MIRTLSTWPTASVTATSDAWILLTIAWEVAAAESPIYMFVSDPDQGFVELKVDPKSGALIGVIVIDPPRVSKRQIAPVDNSIEELGSTTPVIDLSAWGWKVTPDYREPIRRDIDLEMTLSLSNVDGVTAIWFSESAVDQFLHTEGVRVGISSDNELVVVAVSSSLYSPDARAA